MPAPRRGRRLCVSDLLQETQEKMTNLSDLTGVCGASLSPLQVPFPLPSPKHLRLLNK